MVFLNIEYFKKKKMSFNSNCKTNKIPIMNILLLRVNVSSVRYGTSTLQVIMEPPTYVSPNPSFFVFPCYFDEHINNKAKIGKNLFF